MDGQLYRRPRSFAYKHYSLLRVLDDNSSQNAILVKEDEFEVKGRDFSENTNFLLKSQLFVQSCIL